MTGYTPLRPVLDGPSWIIGPSPDLTGLLPDPAPGAPPHECVDHCVYQSQANGTSVANSTSVGRWHLWGCIRGTSVGRWHLWGCIRGTSVGRVLYHWEGQSLTQPNWHPTGSIIRVDRDAGESLLDRDGKEWIQSPYVVRHEGLYYMFYGGHSAGIDADGAPVPRGDPRMEGQICLRTSPDGRTWTRHRNASHRGASRLFIGPGEARDPCLLRVGDLWHLYYAGYHDGDRAQAGFYLRTSPDLLHWSDWRLVHQDPAYGPGPWDTECPHVVYRGGAYYLFRTEHYASAKTHVFCSTDPFDFGTGTAGSDAGEKYVGPLAVAAPEIITDRHGRQYITSNHDLLGGTRLFKLRWEPR